MSKVDLVKLCTRCKLEVAKSDFYGKSSWCKTCHNQYQKKKRSDIQVQKIQQRMADIELKKIQGKSCFRCGQMKDLSEFKTDARKKIGCSASCKACLVEDDRKSRKRYYLQQKAKVAARTSIYRDENRESIARARRAKKKRESIELKDQYLVKLLNPNGRAIFSRLIPNALIEAKRYQVLIQRELQEKSHEFN
jgi:hypothetical protein